MSLGVKALVCKRFDPRGVYTYFEGTGQNFMMHGTMSMDNIDHMKFN